MAVNIPWQDRPEGCTDVMWRYSENPVIGRYDIPSSNSIFNSAVVPFGDGYAGVFRCDNKRVQMNIFAGFSKDGINWDIEPDVISFDNNFGDIAKASYGFDPFEGLPVLFNDTLTTADGATVGNIMIVGDLDQGALANFPAGEEITFKYDDMTLATSDLVRVIGREYVALGVVAPDAFVKVKK